jgi:hypothetical protein
MEGKILEMAFVAVEACIDLVAMRWESIHFSRGSRGHYHVWADLTVGCIEHYFEGRGSAPHPIEVYPEIEFVRWEILQENDVPSFHVLNQLERKNSSLVKRPENEIAERRHLEEVELDEFEVLADRFEMVTYLFANSLHSRGQSPECKAFALAIQQGVYHSVDVQGQN